MQPGNHRPGTDGAWRGRFRVPDGVSAREAAGELVLLDASGGEFFVSRGIGPRVWGLLADGRGIDEIVGTVADRYPDVDRERIAQDVEAFVAELLERGLLEEEPG